MARAADDILVETREASRRFIQGDAPLDALLPTTCRVRRGDSIAIMGPSGSGKSTLLQLIAGLDNPTSGRVEWPSLGAIGDLRPGKVTMAFQSPSLITPLSVLENIELPILLQGGSISASGRATAALELFGLGNLAEKLPEELSGGQAQRVALARAIVTGPQLLLADEPTGQLDEITGNEVISALVAWATTLESAVIVATHDPEVASLFRQIWTMDHGRLILPAEELAS